MMAAFAWGLGKSGQLGNGTLQTLHCPAKLGIKEEISALSTGGLFSAIVTAAGQVYTFGSGKFGRLGTGDEEDKYLPCKIKLQAHIVKVSCGSYHGCALDEEGRLYSWGCAKSHGVIGFYTEQKFAKPSQILSLNAVTITGVSCGHNFTLAWSSDGRAFSWGNGRNGTLGHGDEKDRTQPTQIESLSNEGVCLINAGNTHCGAVTRSGKLFVFGKGAGLGLGSKHDKVISQPTEVQILNDDKQILSLSCSKGEHHGHTLAATSDGLVYAWGDGYKGKLGLGSQESVYSPTLIPKSHFNNENIVYVSCGGIHSTAVSDVGHVFSWGCGSDGRLGHPEAKGHRYLFKSDTPRIIEALKEKGSAKMISASYYHCLTIL